MSHNASASEEHEATNCVYKKKRTDTKVTNRIMIKRRKRSNTYPIL